MIITPSINRNIRSVKFGAALAALAAVLAFTGAANAGPYTFGLIAQTGSSSGTFGSFDHLPSIANDGTVAFSARIHTLGTNGIWTGNGSSLINIISNNSSISIGGPAVINNSGQVGFFGDIGASGGFWMNTGGLAGTNANLFNSPSFGSIHGQPSLNDSGVGAAYVQTFPGSEGIYTSMGLPVALLTQPISTGLQHAPDINNAGHVAFNNLDGNGNRGLYVWNGSTVTQVVDVTTNGLGLETGPNADIENPVINDSGHLAFHGRLATGYFGVFTETGGVVSTIALTGLSGGEYGGIGYDAVSLNNSDEVAFLASVIGSGNGIFTGANPTTDKVIQAGDILFGATVLDVGFSSFGLNDSGAIAFWAQLDDGSYVIARADRGHSSSVPEQSATLPLVILGLSGLAWIRRKKA